MNWLVVAIFLPLAGAGLVWALTEAGTQIARRVALVTALVTLVVAGVVVLQDPSETAFDAAWLAPAGGSIDVRFHVGLDGLSLWMFGLSALLTVTAVLVSWEAIRDRAASFYALLLVLESGMLGVFAARDIILFYIFFEFTLIPLFFLIGIWGSEDRRYAAIKFFLFTLAGSLLTFLGLVAIVLWDYQHAGLGILRFGIPDLAASLQATPMSASLQLVVFMALFAGFAIKVPLFPLHTWLPLAHVQAPTAGSVILAGVLLKIGVYGFVRFSLTMLPDASVRCMPWVLGLSVIGILYGALVALAQRDIKRLIAYSSVSHLGFCMLGLFSLERVGLQGGVLQMVNHGLSTGGLFALVGMLYERYHTREICALGGLAARTPLLALGMVLFTFSSIGLPGMNGFVGEFMVLLGMFQRGWAEPLVTHALAWRTIAVLAVLGVVLGAWYMLWLIERVFFGRLREPATAGHGADHAHEPVRDLAPREILALAPLLVFVFWIGLVPRHFIVPMQPTLDGVSQSLELAFDRASATTVEPPSPTIALATLAEEAAARDR